MKVSVFETEEWEHEACLQLEPDHQISCTRASLDSEAARIHGDAEVISTFVNSRLDADTLGCFQNLRLIATRSAGYDHIDLAYCQRHDITVCNVPDYGDASVAEHAFTLLLAVSRSLVEAVERTRRGNFSQSGLRGFELRGKTLGVIGTGRIGRRAIEIGKGFGMTVLAFDVRQDAKAARDLGFEYDDLLDVLRRSDVVTLHVPAVSQTRHLISDREFGVMKGSAVLINTARGSIVDTEALVRALTAKRIRGAGLDVLPSEPLIRDESQVFRSDRAAFGPDERALLADHTLLRFPNVIVTPHIAFNTDEALRRIVDITLTNIRAFAAGAPQNIVSGPGARTA